MKHIKFGLAVSLAVLTIAFAVAAQAGAFKFKRVADCYTASDFDRHRGSCTTKDTLPFLPALQSPPYDPHTCVYSINLPSGGFDDLTTNCTGSAIPCCFKIEASPSVESRFTLATR